MTFMQGTVGRGRECGTCHWKPNPEANSRARGSQIRNHFKKNPEHEELRR